MLLIRNISIGIMREFSVSGIVYLAHLRKSRKNRATELLNRLKAIIGFGSIVMPG